MVGKRVCESAEITRRQTLKVAKHINLTTKNSTKVSIIITGLVDNNRKSSFVCLQIEYLQDA